MPAVHNISPNLWFDTKAEEAAEFYTSIFPNSKIERIARYPEAGQEVHHKEPGTVMTVDFAIDGQPFIALNGGPEFKFNESISFVVHCDTQEEIDRFWDKLGEGGDPKAHQCGWLKDKFGVSWQIVPRILTTLTMDANPQKAASVFTAMLKMKKLDIAALERAAEG
jgi:predicted 3-demethylubiquinone-9 3-methyltransferase (glyoxalase superfamily)